ncbi:MAG: hypothetical protein HOC05_25550 [Gemmatimonadetes bacterium]|jgi:hypothetical protein|nr:hypothetical protein [Gemmatimonadota bacterium]MBT4613439.1 hypothetical protein [Gemmatimonadota bacterium]MBT5144138.1 hypothetical protein [Gemmatimonadota bacterium]MBT6626545.1 hypothetical protein [Gemmatimonadota bacterium]MBT7597927.1 hypothetical protein [Gemmatimonadota bacterium]
MQLGAALLLALGAAHPVAVGALSSASARFDPPKVAAGTSQSVALLVTYFPGNGEAVTASTIDLQQGATILAATSSRGRVQHTSDQMILDYLHAPIGSVQTDTLLLQIAAGVVDNVSWASTLVTTLDTDSQASHRAEWSLPVAAPLQTRWSVAPDQWYVGETVELQVALINDDTRPLEGIWLAWPHRVRGDSVTVDSPVIVGGEQATLGYTAHILPRPLTGLGEVMDQGRLTLRGTISSGGLRSKLKPLPIDIVPVPSLRVEVSEPLRRNQEGAAQCVWTLSGTRDLQATDLRVSIDGLNSIVVSDTGMSNAQIEFDVSTGSAQIILTNVDLVPGDTLAIPLRLVPRHTGPLAFRPSVTPADRQQSIGISQTAVVAVLEDENPGAGRIASAPTDLELARSGLVRAWTQALGQLPIDAGAAVRLQAEGRHDANWMVEEAVTTALLQRGHRLPMDDDTTTYELAFQIATSQATYEPSGSIWNPLGSRHARDAQVIAHARLLDTKGQILWAQRVSTHSWDKVGSDASSLLGGADAVDQAVVPGNQRPLEVGLSGLIVGGLFFVFFSP